MTHTTRPQTWIPDLDERTALNAALHATAADTGFWDDLGRPAPWPDDIDEWTPCADEPFTTEPGQQPFWPTSTRKINLYTTSRDLTARPSVPVQRCLDVDDLRRCQR